MILRCTVAGDEKRGVEFPLEGINMTTADLLRAMALAVAWIAYVAVSVILVIALVSGWPAVLHSGVSPYQ
jgi:hypothetical protein